MENEWRHEEKEEAKVGRNMLDSREPNRRKWKRNGR